MAKIFTDDKLQQIYMVGLKILDLALKPPVYNDKFGKKILNRDVSKFTKILIAKSEEVNPRGREIAQKSLIGLFSNSNLDSTKLLEEIMEIVDRGP